MLLIRCPYCAETLPEAEFAYAGEAHVRRPGNPDTTSDAQWAGFLFIRSNHRGPQHERWRHVHGCGRFFNAVRDTVSDRFLTTYMTGESRPDVSTLPQAKA